MLKKGELYFHAAGGKEGSRLNQMTVSLDSGIARWLLGHEHPSIANDIAADERFSREMDKVTGFTGSRNPQKHPAVCPG